MSEEPMGGFVYEPNLRDWNESTSTSAEEAQESMGFSFVVLIPAVLCTMGCLSQVVMILIAKGLQGDFSAKTFLQGLFSSLSHHRKTNLI